MKEKINWSNVQKALKERTFSGYKIAVIETNKILDNLLKSKKYPGKTPRQRLKNAWPVFSEPDKLIYSRKMYSKILFENNFDLSSKDTREIISIYWQAMTDLLDLKQTRITKIEKIKLFVKRHFPSPSKTTKKALIGSLIFLLLVLFLVDTSIGQGLTKLIIIIVHFIAFKIIPFLLLFAAISGIIIGLIYLIKKRKKRLSS